MLAAEVELDISLAPEALRIPSGFDRHTATNPVDMVGWLFRNRTWTFDGQALGYPKYGGFALVSNNLAVPRVDGTICRLAAVKSSQREPLERRDVLLERVLRISNPVGGVPTGDEPHPGIMFVWGN